MRLKNGYSDNEESMFYQRRRMKKYLCMSLFFVLSQQVSLSAQNVGFMRAVKCSIPQLYSRFNCTEAEKNAGRVWLKRAGQAAVVTALTALGITAAQAMRAKQDALTISEPQLVTNEQASEFYIPQDKSQAMLQFAVIQNDPIQVKNALSQGARPDGGVGLKSFLEIAAENNNSEIVQILLEAGAVPQISDSIEATQAIKDMIKDKERVKPVLTRRNR